MKQVKIPTEIYSRVVGYFRPTSQWNKGKKEYATCTRSQAYTYPDISNLVKDEKVSGVNDDGIVELIEAIKKRYPMMYYNSPKELQSLIFKDEDCLEEYGRAVNL